MDHAAAQPLRIGETIGLGRAARAASLLETRRPEFLRNAGRFSICPEEAEDAVQRATEILLRKAPDLEPGRLAAWMHVVTRREALALGRERRRRFRSVWSDATVPSWAGADPESVPSQAPGPEQHLERRERVAAAGAQLAALKPQERRAIGLQAAGCSYAEIQAITGWTYTKVNRCMAEGRAALREHVSRSEVGEGR
ncbi:MAG: sigma-70 family RNA polymerase sigma factor [Solirubrobacterales bacterium]